LCRTNKVIKTIQLLLESVEARLHLDQQPRKISSVDELAPKDKRAKVVEEMLLTERKYVQDLEVLVQYQMELQNLGILSADTVHFLFPNLFQLVDFQRRFAIGIEYHASLPPEEQRFGALFVNLQEGFEVYEGYALNMKNACDIAQAEVQKLTALKDIIEPQYELQCFLIKPIQRICKYPLLLRELQKFTPKDWPSYDELTQGLTTVRDITEGINETQRRLENGIVAKELNDRVRDWRGHNIDDFGELLHQGTFPVVKVGFEREYQLYLFENIILCCKEAAPTKKAMTLKKSKSKRSSLVLKGRIYMAYITDVSVTRKDGYLLHISWGKDDASDTGFFDIRFRHEEVLTQWESTIRRMVGRYHQHSSDDLFHNSYPDGDETLVMGSNYDEGSDDELDEFPRTKFQSGSTIIDPLDNGQYSPVDSATSTRSLSTSSSVGYQYHHQQQLSESLNGLRLSGSSMRSREGSAVSLTGSNNLPGSTTTTPFPALSGATYGGFNSISVATRSRSASSPNYPALPSLTVPGMTAAPPVPPLPSMPSIVSNPMPNGLLASRIKSESAVTSVRERSTGSQDSSSSSSSTARSNGSFNSSVATTPISTNTGFSNGTNTTSNAPAKHMKVKLHFLQDSFLLIVPGNISYHQLLERVERKIRLCGKQTPVPLRIKYKDEDDDFVTINSDEDIQMALEPRQDNDDAKNNEILTIWVA
jgi:cell division control protein 24